jgi:hypothetical protein
VDNGEKMRFSLRTQIEDVRYLARRTARHDMVDVRPESGRTASV